MTAYDVGELVATLSPEEKRCPGCSHVVHGLEKEVCPECGERFAWEEVWLAAMRQKGPDSEYWNPSMLPREDQRCPRCNYMVYGVKDMRCPECGRDFEWREIWQEALRNKSGLFEFRWYDNPVPALVYTWRLGMFRPSRLWSVYSLKDRPLWWSLLLLIALQWLVFWRGWNATSLAVDPVMNGLAWLLADTAQTRLRFTYFSRINDGFVHMLALWYVLTFLAMQIFFESKHRCRINWRHVLRVYAHSTLAACMVSGLWCFAEGVIDSSLFLRTRNLQPAVQQAPGGNAPIPVVPGQRFVRPRGQGPRVPRWLYARTGQVLLLAGLLSMWANIWIGYRKHLKMPHGWAIGAVSMFLGWLGTQITLNFVLV